MNEWDRRKSSPPIAPEQSAFSPRNVEFVAQRAHRIVGERRVAVPMTDGRHTTTDGTRAQWPCWHHQTGALTLISVSPGFANRVGAVQRHAGDSDTETRSRCALGRTVDLGDFVVRRTGRRLSHCDVESESPNSRCSPTLRNRAELRLLEVARKEIDRLGRHADGALPSRFASHGIEINEPRPEER